MIIRYRHINQRGLADDSTTRVEMTRDTGDSDVVTTVHVHMCHPGDARHDGTGGHLYLSAPTLTYTDINIGINKN